MVNPYEPPISMFAAVRKTKGVPFRALLAFGVIPVAIIVTDRIESLLFPTYGWNPEDWFWAVGPPSYLVAAWLFALFSHNRRSRVLGACLAVVIIPLLLQSLRVYSISAQWYYFSKTGFEGFGINENYRLFAVSLPLWLVASLGCTLYFCSVILKLVRLNVPSPYEKRGEPSDARETSSQPILKSGSTARSP